MLAPGQIKGYQFQSAGEGLYRADEVDNFIQAVSAAYEKMYTENGSLIQRVNMLADKVKTYQEEEELIKKTLIIAQKKADEIEASSKRQSADLISTAERRAQSTNAAAEQRAKDLLSAAEERARKRLNEASQQSTDTLNGARVTAEKTLETAKAKAAAILSESKKRAEQILLDAKTRRESVLGPLQSEVDRETRALEEVRAQSRAFKDKLTASYQEQLNTTNRLLGFVQDGNEIAQNASIAAAAAETAAAPSVEVRDEVVDVDMSFLDQAQSTYVDDDDLFASVAEEIVLPDEPETVSPVFDEPQDELLPPIAEEPASQEEAPQTEAPQQGFSFVEGFGNFGADPAPQESAVVDPLPEVEMAGFDDIFQSALAENAAAGEKKAEPAPERVEQEPIDEDPFRALRSKYNSTAESTPAPQEEEPQEIFSGFVSRVQQSLQDEPEEEIPETVEELPRERPARPTPQEDKPEKKKHRLSLFSRYEDDDEDDDEDEDEDEYEDDDDDDEDEGGFRGFFRK